jgi:hypothetical protein
MEMSGSDGGTKLSLLCGHTTSDFSDAKVIRKFGDVPDDLSAL